MISERSCDTEDWRNDAGNSAFVLFTLLTGLLESSMRLKPHEAQSYRKKALWVSWISIVVTLILAVAGFTVSFMRHSASAFGFAFDATLDVLSSIIVLWRYSNAAAVHSAHREYIACVILGVIFILSSMCILGKAIHDLATKLLPEVDDFLFSVSIVSGLVCVILAVVKFMLGRILTSRALITDGIKSHTHTHTHTHTPMSTYHVTSMYLLVNLHVCHNLFKIVKVQLTELNKTEICYITTAIPY
uniref:Transmembrane protein 163-like n=1 Tax=Sinocyclocheilus grahami TaxID=75366 RepID=A0A672PYC3_SINGR